MFNPFKIKGMKYLKKIVFIKSLGVSVTVLLNSSCKADGG